MFGKKNEGQKKIRRCNIKKMKSNPTPPSTFHIKNSTKANFRKWVIINNARLDG